VSCLPFCAEIADIFSIICDEADQPLAHGNIRKRITLRADLLGRQLVKANHVTQNGVTVTVEQFSLLAFKQYFHRQLLKSGDEA
jgi:hypothetical protein